MANDYPNSGALWPNKTRNSDKQPNVQGDIKMERGLLKKLMADTDDELIVIALSGWTREYQDSKFISLKASEPYKKDSAPKKKQQKIEEDDSDLPF
jgi:hypothetical protein